MKNWTAKEKRRRAEFVGKTLIRLFGAMLPAQTFYLQGLAIDVSLYVEKNLPPVDGEPEDVPVELPEDEAECNSWQDEKLLGLMLKAGSGGVVERALQARYEGESDVRGNPLYVGHYAAMELAHVLSLTFTQQTERQRAFAVTVALETIRAARRDMPKAVDPLIN